MKFILHFAHLLLKYAIVNGFEAQNQTVLEICL